jgi:hypothetical protein
MVPAISGYTDGNEVTKKGIALVSIYIFRSITFWFLISRDTRISLWNWLAMVDNSCISVTLHPRDVG